MTINRLIELPSEKPPSVTPDFCFSPVLSLPDTPEPKPIITPAIKTSRNGPPKVNYMEVLNDEEDGCTSQKFVPKPPSMPKPKKKVRFRSPAEQADYLDDFESEDGDSKEGGSSPSKKSPTPPPTISHSQHSLNRLTGGDTVFSKKRSDGLESADEVSDEEIECLGTSRPSSSSCASVASDCLDSGSPAYPVFRNIVTHHPSRPHLKLRGRRIITKTLSLQMTNYQEPFPPKAPKGQARHQPRVMQTCDSPAKSPSKNVATSRQPHKPLNAKPQGSDNKAARKKINVLELLPPQPPKKPQPPPSHSNRRRDMTRRYGQASGTGKVTKSEGARRGRHD